MNIKKISALQAILLALGITGLINGVIFSYQTDGVTGTNALDSEIFFPSSKIIGSVWTFLVACLAFSFSRVVKQNTILAAWIFGLFLTCILAGSYFSRVVGGLAGEECRGGRDVVGGKMYPTIPMSPCPTT